MIVCIYPFLLHEKENLTGSNSVFSFPLTGCHTMVKESSQSYNLPISGGKIVGFIPFPMVLTQCEMQTASSRVWTWVSLSIFGSNNHEHFHLSLYYISCSTLYWSSWGCPRGVMVKVMDCGIVVSDFVLQLRYYVHFRANILGKGMNPLILPAMV